MHPGAAAVLVVSAPLSHPGREMVLTNSPLAGGAVRTMTLV
jgi:hypothetical protein